jgi:NADP-reducing hydrogenase subunit HndD
MVIAATAPSVRVGLGDLFNLPAGTNVEKQMVESLMAMGFDKVFDINFGADLTIMEESAEFIERLKNNHNMPMFTSCCPAWVTYVEEYYPQFIKNLSTTKSPQEIFAKVLKNYYAKTVGKDAKDIYFVSIMPCTAKKCEKLKHGDTDAVITVNELAELINVYNIDFKTLKGKEFDDVMGLSSGAGAIFGASGGVMEAALRTAQDTLSGKDIKDVEFRQLRGSRGIKEATVEVANKKINICVASGLNNAKTVLELIKSGKKYYDFVEIMACPGGCINGGGMPRQMDGSVAVNKRSKALYKSDTKKTYRKSHDNPNIKKVYEYLNTLDKNEVHKMLHTTFKK